MTTRGAVSAGGRAPVGGVVGMRRRAERALGRGPAQERDRRDEDGRQGDDRSAPQGAR